VQMNIYDRGKDAGKETAFRRTTSKTSGHMETNCGHTIEMLWHVYDTTRANDVKFSQRVNEGSLIYQNRMI